MGADGVQARPCIYCFAVVEAAPGIGKPFATKIIHEADCPARTVTGGVFYPPSSICFRASGCRCQGCLARERYLSKTPASPDSVPAVGPRSSIGQSCSGKEESLSDDSKLKADPGSSPGVARPFLSQRLWQTANERYDPLLTEAAAELDRQTVCGPAFGYTLATGRLFCDFAKFQEWSSDLVGRPLLTHEFGDANVWRELRDAFETLQLQFYGGPDAIKAGDDH